MINVSEKQTENVQLLLVHKHAPTHAPTRAPICVHAHLQTSLHVVSPCLVSPGTHTRLHTPTHTSTCSHAYTNLVGAAGINHMMHVGEQQAEIVQFLLAFIRLWQFNQHVHQVYVVHENGMVEFAELSTKVKSLRIQTTYSLKEEMNQVYVLSADSH